MNYKAAAKAIHAERVEIWIALGKPWSNDPEFIWKSRQPGFIQTRSGQIIETLMFPKTGWTQFHIDECVARFYLNQLRMAFSEHRPGKTNGLFTQFTEQWNVHSQN